MEGIGGDYDDSKLQLTLLASYAVLFSIMRYVLRSDFSYADIPRGNVNSEVEEIKKQKNYNYYLLAIILCVSLLHTI